MAIETLSAQPSAMMGARTNSGRSTSEGHHVFLEEELDAVGERLQQAERADARGAPAVLHAAEHFALEQHGVGHRGERDDEDHGDLHAGDEEKDREGGQVVHRGSPCGVCPIVSLMKQEGELEAFGKANSTVRATVTVASLGVNS